MGYSPGEFECRKHGKDVHWELKDGTHVVLWDANESKHLLDLDMEQFKKAYDQMRTIAYLIGIE